MGSKIENYVVTSDQHECEFETLSDAKDYALGLQHDTGVQGKVYQRVCTPDGIRRNHIHIGPGEAQEPSILETAKSK